MTAISNEMPQSNFDWAVGKITDTVLPLAIKIGSGSLLTWSNPADVAASFIAQKCFQETGVMAISQLGKHFQLSSDYAFPLAIANFAMSFFAGQAVAQRLGFSSSYLAMGVGTAFNLGLRIYQLVQTFKEEPMKDDVNVITVTQQNFKEEVEDSKLPVVLDVYATWCPPCRMVAPIIAKLAEEMQGKVKFVKMNIDNEPELGSKLDVRAMPTFVYFQDGKEIHRHVGAGTKERFLDEIKVFNHQN